jgi:MFS family permease
MSPRTFLVHGLLAGLLAGLAAFAVAFTVGEPPIDDAIALEESAAASEPHSHDGTEEEGHSHADEGEGGTSRGQQAGPGLATATLAVGTALGGLVALAAAAVMGRIGRLTPPQSTALVAAVGFVAVALVPFLKYPAVPPAVGSGDTIGSRTALYFTFLLVSVVAAGVALAAASRLARSGSAYAATAVGVAGYVGAVVVAAALMPRVDELGAFPADVLWQFRLSSLLTLATLWVVLGFALTGLVGRSWRTHVATTDRRALAASL